MYASKDNDKMTTVVYTCTYTVEGHKGLNPMIVTIYMELFEHWYSGNICYYAALQYNFTLLHYIHTAIVLDLVLK